MTYVIILVVFIGIFFAISKLNGSGLGGMSTESTDALNRLLLERTGFKHTAIPQAPTEEQIAFSNQLSAQYMKTKAMTMELTRVFDGYRQVHTQSMGMSGASYTISASWGLIFNGNPPVVFHLAEKDMNSTSRRLKTGFKRDFQPMYQDELAINDPELANRFKAWGNSVDWLNHILAIPAVKQGLMIHAEVDLCVFPDKISFSDPTQENLRSALGGGAGMRSAAQDPMGLMEVQIGFHDHMGTLLANIAKGMQL